MAKNICGGWGDECGKQTTVSVRLEFGYVHLCDGCHVEYMRDRAEARSERMVGA